ncbi:putative G-protein coupled receptor npr-8 [Caenorhabditis elegans]|uniref:Probable G-protein coupled receptor npr-8 n=2 Tax=Caenorhabditis elegans TaxID=6239 RepID=NPR8_CAEEL|nr:putative G-protein coupled receptor npr-8 [Caenorhabditis elegans]Q18904.1 RecName: Full=Probable G-protein coupled receptor npr-8 [Caenorhabditis elegans]CCD63510.1 Probable G-protein coupled receptor npr-8 [Caenorhabditis elegans]|eukprot:NP_741835.1 Probable G-protein coupled receptor npr-8 [Caenorhabditis elegans]
MEVKDIDNYCDRGISPNASNYLTYPFDGLCLQKFFYQLQTSLRRFTPYEEIIYTTVYIIISVAAVIGNGLVIMAVVRKKTMRTNRNVLILNLALSNLILAITNIPFLWLPSIDFEFPYSRFFCKFANVLPGSNIYCSTLTISVMAIDRYYSVKKLKIASNRKQCFHAVLVSLAIWIVSFILSLPLLLYYETSMLYVMREIRVVDQSGQEVIRSYGWRQCRLVSAGRLPDITQSIQLLMSILQVAFLYIVPLFVLSIFNVKLTRFLKTNANKMSKTRAPPKRFDRSDSHHNSLKNNNNHTSSLRSPSMPSIRSSITERNKTNQRTNRTTSLLIAMAGSYAALWFPFTLITFLIDFELIINQDYVNLVERIDQTCKMVSMLSICVNPFLYGFLNTNFRHEFSDIYYRYIRCETKSQPAGRFHHDVSSIAHHRQDSVYNDEATLLTTGRQSNGKDGSSSPIGFRSSVRVCSGQTKMIGDRIVLDDDIEKDSFV